MDKETVVGIKRQVRKIWNGGHVSYPGVRWLTIGDHKEVRVTEQQLARILFPFDWKKKYGSGRLSNVVSRRRQLAIDAIHDNMRYACRELQDEGLLAVSITEAAYFKKYIVTDAVEASLDITKWGKNRRAYAVSITDNRNGAYFTARFEHRAGNVAKQVENLVTEFESAAKNDLLDSENIGRLLMQEAPKRILMSSSMYQNELTELALAKDLALPMPILPRLTEESDVA